MLHTQQKNHQLLQIQALSHLIEADFDPDKSCHSVCLLAAQLFKDSDDKVMQHLGELALKAYTSSVESVSV
jgi:hypothetical protein